MRVMSLLFLLNCLAIFNSCSKDSGAGGNNTITPSNLVVAAVVSTDNSGNVNFTASATNASTYEFDFGNGAFQLVPAGVVVYKYTASGTYNVNVIAKSSTGQTISKGITVIVTVAQSLVWSDEFNVDGAPDPTKWGYDIGAGGWGNSELEYYTNRLQNAVVQGGTLKINAIKEDFNGSPYTSARLLSKNKFSFKYGKVEVSAKLPTGIGTWPAIWMLGNNIDAVSWPNCGEIDIMEHLGRDLNNIYGTLHYPGRSGSNANGATKLISNATTQFHKYSLEWSAAAIKIYVDDMLFFTFANSTSVPFNQNFFFILNLAMGGNFAGPVDPAVTNATMEIDYIRVYN